MVARGSLRLSRPIRVRFSLRLRRSLPLLFPFPLPPRLPRAYQAVARRRRDPRKVRRVRHLLDPHPYRSLSSAPALSRSIRVRLKRRAHRWIRRETLFPMSSNTHATVLGKTHATAAAIHPTRPSPSLHSCADSEMVEKLKNSIFEIRQKSECWSLVGTSFSAAGRFRARRRRNVAETNAEFGRRRRC